MKKQTFQDFLMEIHADQYEGLDDDMPDNYEVWIGEIDVDNIIEYANEWFKPYNKKEQQALKIVLDFVERWNKQDKDKETADSANILQVMLDK